MKKKILSFVLFLSSIISYSQTYDFSSDPFAAGSGWIQEQDNPVGFSYNASGYIDCSITAQTQTNLLYRPLPNPLEDMFSVSFKITPGNQTNGFFPLILTQMSYAASTPNTHPWREDPIGIGAGNIQAGDFLSVHINGSRDVRLITRVGTSYSVSATVFTLSQGKDYWVELERICPTKVRLSVYGNSAMDSPLGQLVLTNGINITDLTAANLNFLYIANSNGNWTTNITAQLDDYVVNRKKCPCELEIKGNSIICEPGAGGTYSIDLGPNVEDDDVLWSISPSGPVSTTSSTTSGIHSLIVSDWGAPGVYTITVTWECNCRQDSLSMDVTVQQSILDVDPVTVSVSCNSAANTLDFTASATGGAGIWRNWYVYESENMTPGDYTISTNNSSPILVDLTNTSSISMSSLSMNDGYVIMLVHGYDNGICPPDTTYKKVICNATQKSASAEINAVFGHSKPRLYPNPTTNNLNIILPSKSNVSNIKIVDAFGRIIEEREINEQRETTTVSFNVEKLTPGTYFVVYSTKSKENITDKFIKD